jgi:hypothetical protein
MRIRINDWLRPTAVLIGILLVDFLFGFVETAHAQLAALEITPNTATLQVGDQQQFTATGKDPEGNPVTLNNPVWEYTGGGVMIPSGNTAEYTATDLNQLTTIEVTPATANLQVGDQQQFTAKGYDADENRMPFTPKWSATGGTIIPNQGALMKVSLVDSSTVTYTATEAGDHMVVCRDSTTGIADTAYVQVTTGVADDEGLPDGFVLHQNYPNPFNPETTIRYTVKDPSRVVMKVFDLRGREVATLVDRIHPSGFYSVQFDASGLASGIYFCRIRMKDFVAVKKMVLLE